MRGTEKQIKWAEDIKANAYNTIDRNIRVNTDVDNESKLLETLTAEEFREMEKNDFDRYFEITHVKDEKEVIIFEEIRKAVDLFFEKYGDDAAKIIELRHKVSPDAIFNYAFQLRNKK